MRGKHLEFGVIRSVVVAEEEYLRALGQFLLQKTLYARDYAAGFISTIQVVTLLQETPEHIYHQDCISHNSFSPLIIMTPSPLSPSGRTLQGKICSEERLYPSDTPLFLVNVESAAHR